MKNLSFDRVFGFILAILLAAFIMAPFLLIEGLPRAGKGSHELHEGHK